MEAMPSPLPASSLQEGNPRSNLAHCFTCKKNLNNIDLLMTLDYDFRDAVALLERLLNEHQAKQFKGQSPANP